MPRSTGRDSGARAARRSGSSSRTRRCSTRSRWGRTSRSRCGGTRDLPDDEIRERARQKLESVGLGGTTTRCRRPVGRHAQAGRAGARDGARPGDPARGRAERRARPDHVRRDRRPAARAEGAGHHAGRRDAQHPERPAPGRRAGHAARGRIAARGTVEATSTKRARARPRFHARGLGRLLFAVGLFLIGNRRLLFERTSRSTRGFSEHLGACRTARWCAWPAWKRARSPRSRCRAPIGQFRVRLRVRRRPAPAHPDRLGRVDPERRPGRQQVRPGPGGTEAAPEVPEGRHDPQPGALRSSPTRSIGSTRPSISSPRSSWT
jgi:hypothetical protein